MIKVIILFTIIFMSFIALPSFAEKSSKASIALDAGDYETAIKEYKIKADKGHIDSQYMLGLIYEQYVGPDYIEALKWYKLAAEQGDEEALLAVGTLIMMELECRKIMKKLQNGIRKVQIKEAIKRNSILV